MFSIAFPAFFGEYSRHMAVAQVIDDAFYHIAPVGQHEWQPVAVLRLAQTKGKPLNNAPQATVEILHAKHGRQVRSVVGM